MRRIVEHLQQAVPAHGSAPDIAGTGRANPYAMIDSTRMLPDRLGRRRGIEPAVAAARTMEGAVVATLADAQARTGESAAKAPRRR